jgi:hypothetical protein
MDTPYQQDGVILQEVRTPEECQWVRLRTEALMVYVMRHH